MKKYFRYFRQINRMSTMYSLSYINDFYVFLCTLPIYVATHIGALFLTFSTSHIQTISGYNFYEILFVMLFSELILEIVGYTVVMSSYIPKQIMRGELDFYFLKPMHTAYIILFQRIFFYSIPSILLGAALLLSMYFMNSVALDMVQFGYLLCILITSIIILGLLFVIYVGLCFYMENIISVREFLYGLAKDTTSYPKEIYPKLVQNIGLYIIPIFLIALPAFKVFDRTYSLSDLSTTALSIAILGILATLLWHSGLKKYSSAN